MGLMDEYAKTFQELLSTAIDQVIKLEVTAQTFVNCYNNVINPEKAAEIIESNKEIRKIQNINKSFKNSLDLIQTNINKLKTSTLKGHTMPKQVERVGRSVVNASSSLNNLLKITLQSLK